MHESITPFHVPPCLDQRCVRPSRLCSDPRCFSQLSCSSGARDTCATGHSFAGISLGRRRTLPAVKKPCRASGPKTAEVDNQLHVFANALFEKETPTLFSGCPRQCRRRQLEARTCGRSESRTGGPRVTRTERNVTCITRGGERGALASNTARCPPTNTARTNTSPRYRRAGSRIIAPRPSLLLTYIHIRSR